MQRIVIVEDDIYLREELIHTFQKAGYDAAGPASFENVEEVILRVRRCAGELAAKIKSDSSCWISQRYSIEIDSN